MLGLNAVDIELALSLYLHIEGGKKIWLETKKAKTVCENQTPV